MPTPLTLAGLQRDLAGVPTDALIPWTVARKWRQIWQVTGHPCALRHFRKMARRLGYSGRIGPAPAKPDPNPSDPPRE
jgi:hypothetical protein